MILRKVGSHAATRPLTRAIRLGVLGILSAVALSACTSPASSSTRLKVVGAENEYTSVAAQIGGKYVSVYAVMSNPNTDPHTFELSTSVASQVAGAKLIVQNGVGYDTFMSQLEFASSSSTRRVLDVQKLLGLSDATKNPHLWYRVTTMSRVARAIERDLADLAPAHVTYFERRLASFNASMSTLSATIKSFRATYAGTKVATTEPVADYLLFSLGLTNETPFRFQADIMNGVDPSPEDISFQQNLFNHHRVALFCYNAQVSSPVTLELRALASTDHIPVVAVYETMPTPGYDYQRWMLAEIHALQRAIHSHQSTRSL